MYRYVRLRVLFHICTHSLRFIPFGFCIIYVWKSPQKDLGTNDISAYLSKSETAGKLKKGVLGGGGGFNVPSIVSPLSIFFRVEPVRDFLVDSDNNVSLVGSKAQDRERAREGTDRFFKRCGSWPLDVPGEPALGTRQEICDRHQYRSILLSVAAVTIMTGNELDFTWEGSFWVYTLEITLRTGGR